MWSPVVVRVGADEVVHLGEGHAAVPEGNIEVGEGGERAVDERLVGERPPALGGLQLGRVDRQGDQLDPDRHGEVGAGVPGSPVEHEEDMRSGAGPDLPGDVREGDVEGSDADGGQEQPVRPPAGGMHEGVGVELLVALADHGERAAPSGRPDAVA